MKEKKENKEFHAKWENFWYYYKYHVIAAVFVLVMIGVFINDKLQQIDYDYRIAAITENNLTEEQISGLEKDFQNIADDRNKDGEVHVQITNYTISEDENANYQVKMANQTKLMADFEAGDSMIFMYTDGVYETYKEQSIFDVKDGVQLKMADCKGNTQPDVNDLNIAMRLFEGTAMEKKEDLNQYYKDCKKLFENFKDGK